MPEEPLIVSPITQPGTQPDVPSPASPSPTHEPNYMLYISIFVLIAAVETIISYFLFIKKPFTKSPATPAVPSISPSPTITPTPTPVLCTDAPCLIPQFLACTPAKLTMPFMEGSTFTITVYGKENALCRYTLIILDTKTNTPSSSSECRVPVEKMTKDTFGHLFGEDKNPGKEAIKSEQDKLENDYCEKKSPAPTATPSATLSPGVSPTSKKIICTKDDQNCVFTNIIDNFTGGCKPTEVTTTVDTGGQVSLIVSGGANGACRFQMKGLGADQDCLFAKENVTATVIKGMLGMDNIPKDPAFIKIKSASCK